FALTDASGLTIIGTLDVTGHTLVLDDTNAGGIVENGTAIIKAGTLTGSSSGPTTLANAANAIDNLDAWSNTSGAFSLTDASGLTIIGTLDATGQTVALNDSNAGGIAENGTGIIKAGTLTGSSSGPTTLANAANAIDQLSTWTNTGNSFSLTDASGLTIIGTLDATGQTVALNDSNAGGIAEGVNGAINAGTLTGSAAGGA